MINEAIISIETKTSNKYLALWVGTVFQNAEIRPIGTENKNVDSYFLKNSYRVILNNRMDISELRKLSEMHSIIIEKIFSCEYAV